MFSTISKGMFKKPSKPVQSLSEPESSTTAKNSSEIRVKIVSERNHQVTAASRGSQRPAENTNSTSESNLLQSGPFTLGTGNGGPRIIAIGGGKGGIGKSFFSANLAVSLAKMGYKVSLVDLDFGAANLHTCLGVPSPKVGLFDFVSSKVENLEEIGVSGGVPNLVLYGGGQEFWQQVRPQSGQKIRLISKLQKLDSHYVILDLGAGTHVNTLDFFIFSHTGLMVVVPEPTSIENAYVFMKSVLFRKLQSIVKAVRQESVAETLLATLADPKVTTPPFAQLQKFAQEEPEVGQKILQLVQMTQLGIIMNQVRTKGDVDIGQSMTQICRRYFGFSADYLGAISYDDLAWKSVRNRKALCIDSPDSIIAQSFREIAELISRRFVPPSDLKASG